MTGVKGLERMWHKLSDLIWGTTSAFA